MSFLKPFLQPRHPFASIVVGFLLVGAAIIYATLAAQHFGNNWFPKSTEEVLSDGVSLTVLAIGIFLISWRAKVRYKTSKVLVLVQDKRFPNIYRVTALEPDTWPQGSTISPGMVIRLGANGRIEHSI